MGAGRVWGRKNFKQKGRRPSRPQEMQAEEAPASATIQDKTERQRMYGITPAEYRTRLRGTSGQK